jgi:hypothetical protein
MSRGVLTPEQFDLLKSLQYPVSVAAGPSKPLSNTVEAARLINDALAKCAGQLEQDLGASWITPPAVDGARLTLAIQQLIQARQTLVDALVVVPKAK